MSYKNEKLEEFNKYIIGKKVAIIGIGVSNIPLLDYFYEHNSYVTVFDNKPENVINQDVMNKIKKYNMKYFFGEGNLEYLKGFDLIFRSPSALPTIPEIASEEKRGAIVTTEIEMVLKLTPSKTIGVTGTEGKTTTTSIINAIVEHAGYKTFLGGNIGKPIFTQISQMRPEDVVILEMSSFQLMGMDVSPNIALVTNIYPDHLNIHKNYEEYQEAKKEIFKHQNENGIVVLNKDNEITYNFSKQVIGKKIFFSSKEKLQDGYIYDRDDETIKYCEDGVRRHLLKRNEIKLRGIHNYENICAALAVTRTLATPEQQVEAIKKFNGVEHRLEYVTEINGVKYYNDSIGTSPASTIAGLNAFDENIILLAGGSDKGLDYTEVGEAIAKKVGTLILTGPTSQKIEEATKKALVKSGKAMPIHFCSNLEEAVKLAYTKAIPGDVVLLSPASASFDAFENFAQRGITFKKYVVDLK